MTVYYNAFVFYYLSVLVVGMNPVISGLDELLLELNKTNDFHIFCKQVREKLKESHA